MINLMLQQAKNLFFTRDSIFLFVISEKSCKNLSFIEISENPDDFSVFMTLNIDAQ